MASVPMVLLVVVAVLPLASGPYRWSIFEQEILDLCGNRTCHGREHTMCYKPNSPHARCQHFRKIPIPRDIIRSFLMGHNGLRNKVASSQRRPATNMQLLHWDRDLQAMAERWVHQCIVGYDLCDYIGNSSISVGQNIYFFPKAVFKRWEARVMTTWYTESRRMRNNTIDELQSRDISNYTQLVWADTQFVGCGAASMSGGHLVTCYYHPRGNVPGTAIYRVGRRACTRCPHDRSSCSRVFRGLCGIDDSYSGGLRSERLRAIALLAPIVATGWWLLAGTQLVH